VRRKRSVKIPPFHLYVCFWPFCIYFASILKTVFARHLYFSIMSLCVQLFKLVVDAGLFIHSNSGKPMITHIKSEHAIFRSIKPKNAIIHQWQSDDCFFIKHSSKCKTLRQDNLLLPPKPTHCPTWFYGMVPIRQRPLLKHNLPKISDVNFWPFTALNRA
jgi:hypothetical protein